MAKIKKDTSLRKAILQAAITGQLVSNVDGETETGKQLLDRIIEERNKKLLAEWEEKLKDNPKAKKPTPIVASEISEEEIPFEIPENWSWCRLGDVSDIKSSKRVFEKDYVLKGIPFFRSAEIGDLQQNKALKTELFISERHFEELKKNYGVPQKGDLLITSVGTIGNTWISDGRNFYYKDGNITQISKNDFIIPEFYRLFINSPIFTMQVFDTVAGTAYNALTIIKLKNLFFPLPPLAVQNAIVAKLEEVLPFVDAYENVVLQKEELKNALPDSLKKAILQEAIQGKLTESWRKEMLKQVQHDGHTEETGKQLLDRIIEERNAKLLADWEEAKKKNPKAKKPIPIVASEISEEEIPFEIPENWCWCRLGDVFSTMSGLGYKKDVLVEKSEKMIRVLRGGNILDTSYIFKPDDIMISDKYVKPELFLKKNYLITPAVTSLEHIGKIGYVGKDYTDTVVGGFVLMLIPHYHNEILSKYFLYLFGTRWLRDMCKEITHKSGQAFYNLSRDKLLQLQIPLPPLAEQEKIVEIIEQMLPLCEKLGR